MKSNALCVGCICTPFGIAETIRETETVYSLVEDSEKLCSVSCQPLMLSDPNTMSRIVEDKQGAAGECNLKVKCHVN